MADATASGEVDVVIAWDRNRLARPKDPIDGIMLERRLTGAGKRVVYAATEQEADRSFAGGLLGYVEHYQNGDYLRKLSRDTMRGTSSRAKRGLWPGGPTPFGYDRLILDDGTPKRIIRDGDDDTQAVLDPGSGAVVEQLAKGKRYCKQDHETCVLIPSSSARVHAIQRLFADYAAGKPTRVLRDELNASGLRTSRGNWFTVQTILPILENQAYLGKCVYNRRTLSKWHRHIDGQSVERMDDGVEKRPESDWIICDDAWPALVEQKTFDEVQQRRRISKDKTHRRGPAMRSAYLLAGLFFCGVCGGRMTGNTYTNGKGSKSFYYVCGRHCSGHKHECPKRYTVPRNLVEQHILELIRKDLMQLRDDDQLHRYVADELRRLCGSDIDAKIELQRRLAELDQQVAQLRDHLMAMNPEAAKAMGLYEQASQLAADRQHIESDLAAAASRVPQLPGADEIQQRAAAEFDRLDDVLASSSVEEKRELIACYVQKIKADPDRQTVQISLYPTLLSQKIAGTGFEPVTSVHEPDAE